MPSFDIVSKLDMQEIENAIFNATKEINQRYDFKGSNTSISRNENFLVVETEDELKAKQVNELLIGHFVKRSVDPKALEIKSTEPASGNRIRQSYELLEGIEQDTSKKIIENGNNLIVEKPLTLTVHQSEALKEAALKKNVILNVAFQNRLNPAIQILKKNFEKKRFGKVVTATVRLRWCRKQEYYNDAWHGKWFSDGGVINQQAIHHILSLIHI